jgi:competence protein ComEA
VKSILTIAMAMVASLGTAFATVNVNIAQQSELQSLKGLDRHKAKAIIEYRNGNGPYTSIYDLAKVPGLTPEIIAVVAPSVAFTGDAYVPPPKPEKKPGKK